MPKVHGLQGTASRESARQISILPRRAAVYPREYEYKHQRYFCCYLVKVTICVTGDCATYLP